MTGARSLIRKLSFASGGAGGRDFLFSTSVLASFAPWLAYSSSSRRIVAAMSSPSALSARSVLRSALLASSLSLAWRLFARSATSWSRAANSSCRTVSGVDIIVSPIELIRDGASLASNNKDTRRIELPPKTEPPWAEFNYSPQRVASGNISRFSLWGRQSRTKSGHAAHAVLCGVVNRQRPDQRNLCLSLAFGHAAISSPCADLDVMAAICPLWVATTSRSASKGGSGRADHR